MFGDGWEERRDAAMFAAHLASNPRIKARNEAYNRAVAAAKSRAMQMGKDEIIDALCAHNPAYIRRLLETEDERFGAGALAERYARTFYDRRVNG